jgi:hypothetical protein
MTIQQRPVRLRGVVQVTEEMTGPSTLEAGLGWLVQVTLALYLVPVLLLVLLVGGLGLLILAVAHGIHLAVGGPDRRPGTPSGPASSSA